MLCIQKVSQNHFHCKTNEALSKSALQEQNMLVRFIRYFPPVVNAYLPDILTHRKKGPALVKNFSFSLKQKLLKGLCVLTFCCVLLD